MNTDDAIVQMQGVRFSHDGGETWTLDGVDLTIRQGEWICLVGSNGSGKSTLSRLIAGLTAPDEGKIELFGETVFDASGAHADAYRRARRSVGAVFQNPEDQIITTVVEDDVAFGPENLAVEPDTIGQRVRSALQAVDMAEREGEGAPAMPIRPERRNVRNKVGNTIATASGTAGSGGRRRIRRTHGAGTQPVVPLPAIAEEGP